jgi:hypothetical protein
MKKLAKNTHLLSIATICAAATLSDAQAQTADDDNIPWARNSPYAPKNNTERRPRAESEAPRPPAPPPRVPVDAKQLEFSTQKEKQQTEEPKDAKFITYFSGGLMALSVSSGTNEISDFYNRRLGGGTFGVGVISSNNHYFGLDVGVFVGSYTQRTLPGSVMSYNYVSYLVVMPIHLTYNYFAYFDDARRFRFRFGLSAGLTVVQNSEEENYSSYSSYSYKWGHSYVRKTEASISGGGELGWAWQMSENIYLDIGYRLSAFSTAMLNKSIVLGTNQIDTGGKKGFLSHQVILSLGLRF